MTLMTCSCNFINNGEASFEKLQVHVFRSAFVQVGRGDSISIKTALTLDFLGSNSLLVNSVRKEANSECTWYLISPLILKNWIFFYISAHLQYFFMQRSRNYFLWNAPSNSHIWSIIPCTCSGGSRILQMGGALFCHKWGGAHPVFR